MASKIYLKGANNAVGVMLLFLVGCGSNKIKDAAYLGSTGIDTFVFDKDGTCTYEEVHGSDVDTYQGTWEETDEKDTYKIILEGLNMTLYGKADDDGVIMVTSESSRWANESFSIVE